MKIYETHVAPNPRRVRMFLAEKEIEIEYVEIDLLKAEQHTPEFKAKNPFKFVPVLELDDGTCISETVAISRYFEEIQPEPPLFGRDAVEKALIEMWSRRIELYFLLPTGMCFQHTGEYFKGFKKQVPEWGEICRENSRKFFNILDKHFAESTFIAGDNFSIADITAFCTVDFSKVNKVRIQPEHEHLQRWYDSIKARPSSKA